MIGSESTLQPFEVILLAGVVVGTILLLSVAWVWVRRQVFGTGGTVLTAAGVLLIGLFVFESFVFKAGNIEIRTQIADLQKRVAEELVEQGKNEEAREIIEQATQLAPNRADLWQVRGDVLLRNRSIEEAEASYRESLARDPENPLAHSGLGQAYAAEGEYDNAILAFEEALKNQPELTEAQWGIAQVYAKTGDVERARANLEAALADHRDDPEVLASAGRVFLDLEDTEAAKKAFSETVDRVPDERAKVYRDVVDTLEETNDAKAASRVLADAEKAAGRKFEF